MLNDKRRCGEYIQDQVYSHLCECVELHVELAIILQSKINSQKVLEDMEEQIKDDQLMCGKLKSPTKIYI